MDHLENLALVLDKYCEGIPFDEILKSGAKSTILKSLTERFNDKKYSFPSDVFRLLQRNVTYFKNRLEKGEIGSSNNFVADLSDI